MIINVDNNSNSCAQKSPTETNEANIQLFVWMYESVQRKKNMQKKIKFKSKDLIIILNISFRKRQ